MSRGISAQDRHKSVNAKGGFWFATYKGGMSAELFVAIQYADGHRKEPLLLFLDSLPAHQAKVVLSNRHLGGDARGLPFKPGLERQHLSPFLACRAAFVGAAAPGRLLDRIGQRCAQEPRWLSERGRPRRGQRTATADGPFRGLLGLSPSLRPANCSPRKAPFVFLATLHGPG
jgi:hypothetical protein